MLKVKNVGMVGAAVAVALLMGSCFPPPGSKRPLGPPADVATHPPELIGVWELINCYGQCNTNGQCGGELLLLRTDGMGAWIFENDYGRYDDPLSWSTDGPVLFGGPMSGDYTLSDNTLRIKRPDRDCVYELKLKARDIKWE
jgi:hypothetical protein